MSWMALPSWERARTTNSEKCHVNFESHESWKRLVSAYMYIHTSLVCVEIETPVNSDPEEALNVVQSELKKAMRSCTLHDAVEARLLSAAARATRRGFKSPKNLRSYATRRAPSQKLSQEGPNTFIPLCKPQSSRM